MNPHQKAIELTNRFVTANMEEVGELAAAIVSKECALIAVDEIINALQIADITSMDGSWYINEWEEVKQEIETLWY